MRVPAFASSSPPVAWVWSNQRTGANLRAQRDAELGPLRGRASPSDSRCSGPKRAPRRRSICRRDVAPLLGHPDRPVPTHSSRHSREVFPVEAARDLLGITRALYRAERDGAGDPVRLEELKRIGERLRMALTMARLPPGTLGHSAAWSHADEAIDALGKLVHDEKLAPIIAATATKVRTGR